MKNVQIQVSTYNNFDDYENYYSIVVQW